jgi:hypothetical protein
LAAFFRHVRDRDSVSFSQIPGSLQGFGITIDLQHQVYNRTTCTAGIAFPAVDSRKYSGGWFFVFVSRQRAPYICFTVSTDGVAGQTLILLANVGATLDTFKEVRRTVVVGGVIAGGITFDVPPAGRP